jgi:hypothetical protein
MKPDRLDRQSGPVSDAGPHPALEELAAYIDDLRAGLETRLPAALVAHVENCPSCQGQILDVLFYLRDPLPAPRREAGRRRPPWMLPAARYAAAACLFMLLLTAYVALSRRPAPVPPASDGPGASRHSPAPLARRPAPLPARHSGRGTTAPAGSGTPAKGDGGADSFAVNLNLESMVGSRSRGLVIEVHSPPNHAALQGAITFSWKDFGRESLSLSIVDNRNETVFRSPVAGGAHRFSGILPPGCYYWKLESATELYYVGKFFIPAVPNPPKG